jgi:hypothetical protein
MDDQLEQEAEYNAANLISENFTLCIILEMTVALETALNKFPELLGKGLVVEEVVDTKT